MAERPAPQPRRKRPRAGGVSLTSRAYEAIRSAILSGELPLGGPISGRGLARRLRMSLLPVAQALRQLENDGLVESRPRAGTVVRMPTAEDIRGHYVIREALETQSARLFAERATIAERRELRAMAAALDTLYAGKGGARQDANRTHATFHHRIAECAGCPELVSAIEKSHVLVLNWLYNSAADFHPPPRRWHRDLAEVLTRDDPEAADRKMREHVRFGLETVLRRLAASQRLADAAPRVFIRQRRRRQSSAKNPIQPTKPKR
ncbi:MAG: GntR family transcriptional regulator [Verrucomicrobiae bacterium]|nr:GntR family transcriptional regulator [Verrucomicrobiae bacterium]